MIKIGIVGLGLIGGSILKALYKKSEYELFCCSNSSWKKALRYTKNTSSDIKILSSCDVIFVCSKVSKTLDVLKKLDSFVDKKTIVLDTASIKQGLLDKKFNYNFILTHPMAGSEKSGFEASSKALFEGSRWLVEKNNKILRKIISDTGAKPLKIDMRQHDKMCAQISHLPTILSFLLFDTACDSSLKIASSGFRDTTRLAMTNPELAINMFNQNQKNILKTFDDINKKLNSLKKMSDDEKIKLFSEIAQKRAKMYDKNGKNIFKI